MSGPGFPTENFWQRPPGSFASLSPESDQAPRSTAREPTGSGNDSAPENANNNKRYYPSRMCRICLENVPPTFHPPSDNLPEFFQPKPRVVYESADPEFGRLLRPCKCKGSSRYVHEGCLQSWRHADPAYSERNYWQCPTCKFQYRLERLRWARWISSTSLQLGLTMGILMFTIFLLGFVADPIINLYVDPLDTIFYTEFWEPSPVVDAVSLDREDSWLEHFVKGLASLGVLSFLKVLFAMSPWHWWNFRGSSFVSRGRTTGRSRVASISWLVVLVGIGTFLWVSSSVLHSKYQCC